MASAPRLTPAGKPTRVLVVDDDAEVRQALAEVLQENGYSTIEAATGGHALAILEGIDEIDLVLLDMSMPEPDGFDILLSLKARQGGREVPPVICLSARSAVEDKVRGLKLGAFDYLAKPFDVQELFARMARSLRVKRTLDRLSHDKSAAEQLSMTDPLTGLPNRRDLEQRLKQEVDRAGRQSEYLALLVIDVDRFKSINDQLGHAAGDTALVAVARALAAAVRSFDIVARHGGDEFVVVLPGADLQGAQQTAEALRQIVAALEVRAGDKGERLTLSISVGVAACNGSDTQAAASLFEHADAALLEAKRAGRNQVVTG